MTDVRGRVLPELDRETIRPTVSTLFDRQLDTGWSPDGVLVVPDVHYPFHPSTGLVTNPDVVDAVVAELRDRTDAPVALGVTSTDDTGRQTAEWIGYSSVVERHDVDVVDLHDESATTQVAPAAHEPVRVDLPAPLADRAVVNVPTVRSDPELSLVAASANLALAGNETNPRSGMRAVPAAVDPVVTLVDGTYTHVGGTRASQFLLAGDHRAVDLVLREAVDSVEDLPYLDSEGVDTADRLTLGGIALDEITESLGGAPSRRDGDSEPGDVMQAGYRLYARLSGDLLPPQMLEDDA
ncbi:hypothetical protein C2R22_14740 [Salinigranum rubrum]|uniref:DUF362 domain-containing protein n=1 Tax=Salinigranum rubrum TaxID=755307 RepID=A0A2I8VLI1_9EURY|nr:DUF362 domain-containing protein [Salinigranum rubrum]AUV82745.1 hypothetical protein C2R22_14740 [Salinigranum rubrum]